LLQLCAHQVIDRRQAEQIDCAHDAGGEVGCFIIAWQDRQGSGGASTVVDGGESRAQAANSKADNAQAAATLAGRDIGSTVRFRLGMAAWKGGAGGDRTRMLLRARDFKSLAAASFATAPGRE
jgi:hypothetical protein